MGIEEDIIKSIADGTLKPITIDDAKKMMGAKDSDLNIKPLTIAEAGEMMGNGQSNG